MSEKKPMSDQEWDEYVEDLVEEWHFAAAKDTAFVYDLDAWIADNLGISIDEARIILYGVDPFPDGAQI